MSRGDAFQFCLYRTNLLDDEVPPMLRGLPSNGKPIGGIEDELSVYRRATDSAHDQQSTWRRVKYLWVARNFRDYGTVHRKIRLASLVFARAEVEREGPVIKRHAIAEGTAVTSPPVPQSTHLFLLPARHIAAVEYNSVLMHTNHWRERLHNALMQAARALNLGQYPTIEPIPTREQILDTFNSFDSLQRLYVRLRLPNPDLTRYTQELFERLAKSGIRDYRQDMRNPNGLSQNEGTIPHASAAMAQSGYKQGEVIMGGVRDGKQEEVRTGDVAARYSVPIRSDLLFNEEGTLSAQDHATLLADLVEKIEEVVDGIQGETSPSNG